MSTLEAAFATEAPNRERARLFLALANAAMAGVVGALTLGAAVAVIGALAMLILAYLPILWQGYLGLDKPNKIACRLALCVLGIAAGAVVWGIQFAFGFAVVLAPVMLAVVAVLAGANSLEPT